MAPQAQALKRKFKADDKFVSKQNWTPMKSEIVGIEKEKPKNRNTINHK